MMIPRWAIHAITIDRVSAWQGNESNTKTLEEWRSYLCATVKRTWNDPSRRPSKPLDPQAVEDARQAAKAREAAAEARDEAHRKQLLATDPDGPETFECASDLLEGVQ